MSNRIKRKFPCPPRPATMEPKHPGVRVERQRRTGAKGASHASLIEEKTVRHRGVFRSFVYHATKGWRSVNATPVDGTLLGRLFKRAGIEV